MIAHANTTWEVLRGTTTNTFGDEVDNNTVAASGIPGGLKEVAVKAGAESTGDQRVVRKFTLKLPRTTDLVEGDRLRDASGRVFLVDHITVPESFGLALDMRVDLTLVDT